MNLRRLLWLLSAALALVAQPRLALTPEGLVFEAERIALPPDAWLRDQRDGRHWCLWTTEDQIDAKRSGGAVLASPSTAVERPSPEDGAPPLHCRVTGLQPGAYHIYVSAPGARPLAYSLDGRRWRPYAGGELNLGYRNLPDGRFEFWVDDRYPYPPGNAGSGYFDYVRFVPARPGEPPPRPAAVEHLAASSPAAGVLALTWTTSALADTGRVEYGPVAAPFSQHLDLPGTGRNHRATLTGLEANTTYQLRIATQCGGADVVSGAVTATATPARQRVEPWQTTLTQPSTPHAGPQVVTFGLPLPRGVAFEAAELRLLAAGQPLRTQAEPFGRWADGSLKWVVLSASVPPHAALVLDNRGGQFERRVRPEFLQVTDDAAGWHVRTDALAFDLPRPVPALFCRVGWDRNGDGTIADDERIAADPLGANLRLDLGDGTRCTCGPPTRVITEISGPVRAVLRLHGPIVSAAGPAGFSYDVRLTLWQGRTELGVDCAVIREATTPLFAPIQALALRVPLEAAGGVRGAFDGAALQAPPDADGNWLLQDSEQHFARRDGTSGKQAVGVAVAADGRSQVAVAMADFWQRYPSGFALKPDGIHVRLLPWLAADAYTDPVSKAVWGKLFGWCRDGQYQLRAGEMVRKQILVHYGPLAEPVAWAQAWQQPARPQATSAYLCATGVLGRPLAPRAPGLWDRYDAWFDQGFAAFTQRQASDRAYGWANYGDWYGERECNWGNNEYDLSAAMVLQWMRTGNAALFEAGRAMAEHNATIDTIHGGPAAGRNGLVYEHSFGHVGTDLDGKSPQLAGTDMTAYLARYGASMFLGAVDRQGHVFLGGLWLYAALTGDPFLAEQARRVADNQAEQLTPSYDFTIERAGGWPLINMANSYAASGDPFYLNAARLMIERTLERQDPATGGWLHQPPLDETDGEKVLGGKAFAVGILSHGILRYLEQEPERRPEVERMVVRGADWLREQAWNPGKGYRYITNCAKYRDTGSRGETAKLCAELIVAAYQVTGDRKYLEFYRETMADAFDKPSSGMGKSFTQNVRQTAYALQRLHELGLDP